METWIIDYFFLVTVVNSDGFPVVGSIHFFVCGLQNLKRRQTNTFLKKKIFIFSFIILRKNLYGLYSRVCIKQPSLEKGITVSINGKT